MSYRVWRLGAQLRRASIRPAWRRIGRPAQLLLGHCDTVWPLGTLADMPLTISDGMLRGPGSYDMKAGLVQMLYALQALHSLRSSRLSHRWSSSIPTKRLAAAIPPATSGAWPASRSAPW